MSSPAHSDLLVLIFLWINNLKTADAHSQRMAAAPSPFSGLVLLEGLSREPRLPSPFYILLGGGLGHFPTSINIPHHRERVE